MTHKFVVVDDVSQQQFIVAFMEEIKNTREFTDIFLYRIHMFIKR